MDAIQSLTGCTFGKGNLLHRDYGKSAFTFFRRSDGRAVRLATRNDAWGPPDPAREEMGRRVRAGQGTPEERRAFQEQQRQRSGRILDAPLEMLFTRQPVHQPPPRKARVHTSLVCERCGEPTMETRVRHFGGQTLCQPCFEGLETRL